MQDIRLPLYAVSLDYTVFKYFLFKENSSLHMCNRCDRYSWCWKSTGVLHCVGDGRETGLSKSISLYISVTYYKNKIHNKVYNWIISCPKHHLISHILQPAWNNASLNYLHGLKVSKLHWNCESVVLLHILKWLPAFWGCTRPQLEQFC